MAGPRLFMETVADPPQGGIGGTSTKFLWRPSFYVVMGAPSAEGGFTTRPNGLGGYDSDSVLIPIGEARSHFGRQYKKLFRWVLPFYGAHERLRERVERGSNEWRVLRRTLALFGSDDYLEVLRELAEGGALAVTITLDLDTEREDVEAAYIEAEAERCERTQTYNRILNLLEEGDLDALVSEPALAEPDRDDEYECGISVLRWLSGEFYRRQAFDHPLLREEEVRLGAALLEE